jgi:hypothetical protein
MQRRCSGHQCGIYGDISILLILIYPTSKAFNKTLLKTLVIENRIARREARESSAAALMPPAGLLGKPCVVIYRYYPVATLKVTR